MVSLEANQRQGRKEGIQMGMRKSGVVDPFTIVIVLMVSRYVHKSKFPYCMFQIYVDNFMSTVPH
jgi:hypothetical protein